MNISIVCFKKRCMFWLILQLNNFQQVFISTNLHVADHSNIQRKGGVCRKLQPDRVNMRFLHHDKKNQMSWLKETGSFAVLEFLTSFLQ